MFGVIFLYKCRNLQTKFYHIYGFINYGSIKLYGKGHGLQTSKSAVNFFVVKSKN